MDCTAATTRMFCRAFGLLFLTALLVAGNASSVTTTMPEEASIAETLNKVTELLQRDDNKHAPATFLEEITQRMEDLATTLQHLDSLNQKMSEKELKIQSILQQANAQQIKNLEDRLKRTLESEIELREKEDRERKKLEELLEERRTKKTEAANDDSEADDIVVEVTSAHLAERLDTNAILGESEEQMKRWVLSVVESEVNLYKKGILDKAPTAIDATDTSSDEENADNCPSLNKIVQNVQQALNDHANDGIGRTDHAQEASVVHWLTSKTYSPPIGTLGSVWWNKFIPEDWERWLFPEGWENFEVGIPSYVYHSLGFMSGSVPPPEAVLQKNTLPGSCWPMEGSSGQIVLKLAYPVVVESVSVDHASAAILPEGKHNSAPKTLKIVGYPTCDEGDANCGALGFDTTDPIEIADIEYDAQGPSIQTFESHYAKAMASLPEAPATSLVGDNEEGSCSSVQASCSAPPKTSVAAIEVRVLENWGNFDFTCLYRLRVHGEPEKI